MSDALHHHARTTQKTQRLMNRLWTRIKTGQVAASAHRQRRCSQSHCSGCSRTQPSTTSVIDLHGACDVDLAVGVARRRDRLGQLDAEAVAAGSRTTRMPWIGQSKCRASCAISGLALARRPKNVTSTPLARSTDRPACRRARRAPARRASLTGASRPVGISVPMQPRAHRDDRVGDRADVRPAIEHDACRARRRARASAGSSQFARCAAKTSAGLPSSRSRSKRIESLLGRDIDASGPPACRVVNPTGGRDARTRRRRGRDCPRRRAGSSRSPPATSPGTRRARLARPMRCSGSQGPTRAHQARRRRSPCVCGRSAADRAARRTVSRAERAIRACRRPRSLRRALDRLRHRPRSERAR